MDGMFLHTSSVEVAFVYGVYVIFDLWSMELPSTKITELDKTQHKVSGYVEGL